MSNSSEDSPEIMKQVEEFTIPSLLEGAATATTTAVIDATTEARMKESITKGQSSPVRYEFSGLPDDGKIEYGGKYVISARPTPSRLVISLFYHDRNDNLVAIKDDGAYVETDGTVATLHIPDMVRRKAKRYPQGDYEIRCSAFDADGNESKAIVDVVLEPWGSEVGRRGK